MFRDKKSRFATKIATFDKNKHESWLFVQWRYITCSEHKSRCFVVTNREPWHQFSWYFRKFPMYVTIREWQISPFVTKNHDSWQFVKWHYVRFSTNNSRFVVVVVATNREPWHLFLFYSKTFQCMSRFVTGKYHDLQNCRGIFVTIRGICFVC